MKNADITRKLDKTLNYYSLNLKDDEFKTGFISAIQSIQYILKSERLRKKHVEYMRINVNPIVLPHLTFRKD